jgi:RNA polymerase sigma factor (sigma-70 family)
MLDRDTLECLNAADWRVLYPRLVAYAQAQTVKLPFMKGGGALPKGREPDDLAREAITLVYEGKRRWDRSTVPDLLIYLRCVIDSLMSNLLTSAEHQRRTEVVVEVADDVLPMPDPDPGPLDERIAEECLDAFEQICTEAVADDEELQLVRMGLEDELPSRDIASLFSIPVNRVYQLTRKLRRRIRSAMQEHPCWHSSR